MANATKSTAKKSTATAILNSSACWSRNIQSADPCIGFNSYTIPLTGRSDGLFFLLKPNREVVHTHGAETAQGIIMWMRKFESPYGMVTLTNERWQHILEFHLDVAGCIRYFEQTLARPEQEIRSTHDASVVIFYRFLPRRKRYLAVVVKTGARPFVLTAYLAKKPKSDIIPA